MSQFRTGGFVTAVAGLSLGLLFTAQQAQSQVAGDKIAPTVPSYSEIAYVDGAGNQPVGEVLACDAASPRPTVWARNENIRLDLSFGRQAGDPDRLASTDSIAGGWAVRNIFPAKAGRPETVASVYFDGYFTHGTVNTNPKSKAYSYDLYGRTNFTGSLCDARADYDARHYVRIYGFAGNDQEIHWELSRQPARDIKGFIRFADADIYARGVFRGSIAAGITRDASRIRTSLSRRR